MSADRNVASSFEYDPFFKCHLISIIGIFKNREREGGGERGARRDVTKWRTRLENATADLQTGHQSPILFQPKFKHEEGIQLSIISEINSSPPPPPPPPPPSSSPFQKESPKNPERMAGWIQQRHHPSLEGIPANTPTILGKQPDERQQKKQRQQK